MKTGKQLAEWILNFPLFEQATIGEGTKSELEIIEKCREILNTESKRDASFTIKNCEHCPHAKVSKVYTSDSFDDIRSIHCKLLNKEVHSYLDWNDDSPIPEECPAKV